MSRQSPAFFLAGCLAAATIWFALFVAQLGMATRGSTWIHSLVEAKEHAAANIEGPRLIVLGGSGTLYSLRARDLSRELGIPVLNAGLHAGLGRRYILDMGRRLARPGDTIVLSLEYELYFEHEHNPVLVDYLSAWEPQYFRAFDLADQVNDIFTMKFSRLVNPLLLQAFNAYPPYDFYVDGEGDLLRNNSVLKLAIMARNISEPPAVRPVPAYAREDFAGFADWALAHHVRLLAVPPCTAFFHALVDDPGYEQRFEAIEATFRELGIPFVQHLRESLLDRGLFFDSMYHASDLGAKARTRELARLLLPYVKGRHWGPAPGPVQRGDDPTEVIDANFRRFEPLSGFGNVQGIQPPLPQPFISALPPRSEAVIRVPRASRAHVTARLRGSLPGQAVEVRLDGVPIASWSLESEFRTFEADVTLHGAANPVVLLHSGAQGPVDISAWKVEMAGEAR